ncbi:hypothetical protein [Martelella mangrovi]|uniref:Uncharacterized protein n=1 Tax=Martelella mangrovi TaxID=1397477 RepID=A0ABV2ICZ8_9HYPH
MTTGKDKTAIDLGLAFRGKAAQGSQSRNHIEIDFDRYQHFLDESDMSEAQKQAFLSMLWSIMLGFVDLGFGIHPMQQVCGEDTENLIESPQSKADNKATSANNITKTFANTASGDEPNNL